MGVNREQENLEAVFTVSCHFVDWDEVIDRDYDGPGTSFKEGNTFVSGHTF